MNGRPAGGPQDTGRRPPHRALAALACAASLAAAAEPVTTIRDHGPADNRADIAILGDGYQKSQLPQYAADAERVVAALFLQQPFRPYRRYFNVHRIDVTSRESGADHPERDPPVERDTALGASYGCNGLDRLICVDYGRVYEVLQDSVQYTQRDIVLVLVNDPAYGGSGGAFAVASLDPAVVELVLHELGHSFAALEDEYVEESSCNGGIEPWGPNATTVTLREQIKWNTGGGPPRGWIEPATPLPTSTSAPGIPGLYEGANYCASGVYRPTWNSKMRSLYQPFEQINEEQLVKSIYNWVAPIDSYQPRARQVRLAPGAVKTFRVSGPRPTTHALQRFWYVDGLRVGSGPRFDFAADAFGEGRHTVKLVVRDRTPKVRNDPTRLLRQVRSWIVNVTPPA